MKTPRGWSDEQLTAGLTKAIPLFRQERMEEPLEAYLGFFEEYQGAVEDFLKTNVDLARLDSTINEILGDKKLQEAFRYLAAENAIALFDLFLHHRDPFDRLLMARALSQDMPIVTCDERVRL